MGLYQWNDNYSVGIVKFDVQHKAFLDGLSNLYDIMEGGGSRDVFENTLRSLREVLTGNFIDEEASMEKINYIKLVVHKRGHKEYLKMFDELPEKTRRDKSMTTVELIKFLFDWQVKHIKTMDKDYRNKLNI